MKSQYELTRSGIIKVGFFTHLLSWCAGVPVKDLLKVPENEQIRIKALGAVLWIPPLLSLFSGYYFFYTSFKQPLLALIITPVVASLIFLIDRFIVITLKPQQNFSEHFKSPLFYLRIIFSIALAYVISKPIELKFFEDSIKESLLSEKNEVIQSINSYYTSKIDSVNQILRDYEEDLSELRNSYIREADGSGGTRTRGIAEITKLKYDEYMRMRNDFNILKKPYEGEIQTLKSEKQHKIQELSVNQSQDIGALLRTFSNICDENLEVMLYSSIIFLVLVLFDLTPLIGKLLLKPGSLQEEYHTQELKHLLRNRRRREIYQRLYEPILKFNSFVRELSLNQKTLLSKSRLTLEGISSSMDECKQFESLVKDRFNQLNDITNQDAKLKADLLLKKIIDEYYSLYFEKRKS